MNINKDAAYREKYKKKLDDFIRDCTFATDIKQEYLRKEEDD